MHQVKVLLVLHNFQQAGNLPITGILHQRNLLTVQQLLPFMLGL